MIQKDRNFDALRGLRPLPNPCKENSRLEEGASPAEPEIYQKTIRFPIYVPASSK